MIKGIPDKLDRYRLHLLEGGKLNKKERKMLERFRKANSMLCMGYSRLQVVTIMMGDVTDPISEAQAYAIIREATKLYGDVNESERLGKANIMYENFMLAANQARKKEDFGSWVRALENASKIQGVFDKEKQDFDFGKFMQIPALVFSTDPEVLKLQQRSDSGVEDTDYEDAE